MFSRKWLIVAVLACALASACSQYNTNLSLQTASSVLTFVSPSTATVGGPGFTITANGTGFTTGALILWNGTALTTTLVSANQLTAPVPASDIATAGTVQVAVQIPGSAQSATQNIYNTTTTEISDIVLFTIGAQPGTPPAITSISASTTSAASTPYCSTQGFTLTVNGKNFTSDAVVNWNGAPLSTNPTSFVSATTFVSATQLTAAVPASDVALPGAPSVTVTNSLGTSNSLPINLSTPAGGFQAPTITSISPATVGAGSQAVMVTVQGNVLPCTIAQWVDSNNVTTTLPTTYVPAVAATQTSPGSPASLVATVPPADLAKPGSTSIDLINPGSAASSKLAFTIGAPSVSSVSSSDSTSANTTPACSPPGVTLTVTGTNFVSGSVVDWTTQTSPPVTTPLGTTFVSSTQLVATIPAANIAFPGTVNIEVSNSGTISAPVAFTISPSSPAAPANISFSQTGATAGSAPFNLIVNGTNLLPCSVVQWTNGGSTTQLVTTYVSPTQNSPAQLSAAVPAADIAAVGTAQVAVVNPPGTSSSSSTPIPFPIVLARLTSLAASNSTPYCNSTGITLTVTGTGFANGLVVNWNGSPRPTTLVSATQLTAAITPADTAFLATGTAAPAITVSGSGPGTNSNSLKFPIAALPTGTNLPSPAVSSISPTNAAVEALTGPPVPLAVNGTGLSPCSVVQWNGAPLPTSIFIGTSGMASVIPAADLTSTSLDQISVATPTPGGGTSGNEPFTVYSPGSPVSHKIAGGALSLPLMSSDQRYAVFVLASTDGVTEDPGSTQNIFVKDTCTGAPSGCSPTTTLVSVGMGGAAANGDSISPSISGSVSADGRYVTFLSSATNLVASDTNAATDAFVRDTCVGAASGCTPSTQRVSVTTGGVQANGPTTSATIDLTGRYITFASEAANLGSVSPSGGIFLRDTCAGVSGCTPTTQPLN